MFSDRELEIRRVRCGFFGFTLFCGMVLIEEHNVWDTSQLCHGCAIYVRDYCYLYRIRYLIELVQYRPARKKYNESDWERGCSSLAMSSSTVRKALGNHGEEGK